MAEAAHLFGPLQSAALIEPHAADVLQESRGALNASLVGEVALVGEVVDDGVAGLDAHQAPRAAGEVGKLLVLGRDGSHGRARVVAGDGDDGHGAHACQPLHLVGQHADDGARADHLAELRAAQSYGGQQSLVELTCAGVEHLRGRCDGVFAHLVARQHPAQCIGHEQYLLCMLECRVLFAPHGIELEDAVEVHQLNAGDVVDLALADDVLQVVVHGVEGDGVAIGARVAQDGAVGSDADEVDAPRVDADRGDRQSAAASLLQSADDLEV